LTKEELPFADEIYHHFEQIKLFALEYLGKLLHIFKAYSYKVNPSDALRNTLNNSKSSRVKEKVAELTLLISDLKLYRGFTLYYIDFFLNSDDSFGKQKGSSKKKNLLDLHRVGRISGNSHKRIDEKSKKKESVSSQDSKDSAINLIEAYILKGSLIMNCRREPRPILSRYHWD